MSRGPFATGNVLERAAWQPPAAGDWTLAVWLRPAVKAWETLWFSGDSAASAEYVRLVIAGSGGALRCQHKSGGATTNSNAPGTVVLGAWNLGVIAASYHAAALWVRVWLNGQRSNMDVPLLNWPPATTAPKTALGYRASSSPAHWFTGRLGPVGFWTRRLGQDELAAMWAHPLDLRRFGPAGYWECRPDAAGDEPDLVGGFDFGQIGTVAADSAHPALRRRSVIPGELGYRGAV